jgi:acyl carrier protein
MHEFNLITESIQLELLTPDNEDLDLLYRICNRPDQIMTWRYRGKTVSKDKFIADLWQETLVASVVWRKIPNKRTKYRVGFLTAYNANFRNQIVYLSVIAFPPFQNSGLVIAGIERFIDNIFYNWPFRKIYFETLDFNMGRFGSVFKYFADEEGRFKDFEFYEEEFHDLIVGSISREKWKAVKELYRNKFSVEPGNILSDKGIDDEELFDYLTVTIKSLCNTGAVNLNRNTQFMNDLDMDSLDLMELLVAVESKLNISFDDEELFDIVTIGDLCELVKTNITS